MSERDPKEVIQAALTQNLIDKNGSPLSIRLLPPMTQREKEQFEREVKRHFPEEILKMLQLYSGLEFAPIGTVDFLGRDMSVETFFPSIPILADGYGNFWVVDLASESGEWGPVIFWCHDPPVAAIQARTISDFLEQIFDVGRPEHKDALSLLRKNSCSHIWTNEPFLVPVVRARESNDPVLSAFANGLPNSCCVADLRKAEPGSGFSWGKSKSEVKRYGKELMFAVDRK